MGHLLQESFVIKGIYPSKQMEISIHPYCVKQLLAPWRTTQTVLPFFDTPKDGK